MLLFGLALVLIMLFRPAGLLPSAVRKRVPFTIGAPKSSASQCMSHLAMRLAQGVAVHADNGAGFFNRVSRWFFKG